MKLQLTAEVKEKLFDKPFPSGGGFQNFISRLQAKCSEDGGIEISEGDEAKIKRYAKNGQGGWQNFFGSLVELINQSK